MTGMVGSGIGYSSREAFFLLKVQDTKPWSIFVSKEGYTSKCKDIGMMIPFSQNYEYVYIVESTKESKLIPSVSLNFTFDINNELLSDVFVQGILPVAETLQIHTEVLLENP